MKTKIHGFFGLVALFCVLSFWTGTVYVEAFGTLSDIAIVKLSILKGMGVLVPAMMLTGISGFSMKWKGPMVERKKWRMKIIAANGMLVLLPSAFFLNSLSQQGIFDSWFYGVQGSVNCAVIHATAGSETSPKTTQNLFIEKHRVRAGKAFINYLTNGV